MSMDRANVLALFDRELRFELTFPEARREALTNIVRILREPPGMNQVTYSRLDETNADAEITEQAVSLARLDQPFSWKVYSHDTPPDLPQRLERHGFRPDVDGPGDIMALDLHEVPPALLEPVSADIRPLTRPEQLEDVIRVMEAVWGGNFAWMRRRMGAHMEIPGYLSMYAAYADGQPVCAGWTYFPPNSVFTSLWGGSTLPEYRGRGFYTAVLAARVQEAARRSRRYMVIDANANSRPIVARHGFQYLTSAIDYEWKEK